MKILVMSPSGDGIGLAHQLQAEGHAVVVHFFDDWDSQQGEGMLWKSNDWQEDAKAADFVIFDQNGKGESADRLRNEGIKVWCGGSIADRLEHDRTFGSKVLAKLGIPVPETFFFGNASEAKKVIEAEFRPSERVVVKLNKATSASSYCSKDRADCLGEIESWEKHYAEALNHGGIVQRYVEGFEVSVDGFFDGETFRYPYNFTFEEKRLLTDNLGPNVGCAWSLSANVRARHPKLAAMSLEKMVPLLAKSGYRGHVDINFIVGDEDDVPRALEFTSRIGYEGTSQLIQALPGYGETVARCLGISDTESLVEGADRPWDMCVATRLYVPPYPFETMDRGLYKEVFKLIEGTPVECPPIEEGFVQYDTKIAENSRLCLAGTCGVVGIALGKGKTVEDATRASYAVAERVSVPNLGYRTDGGDRAKIDLERVKRLNLI